MADMIAKLKEIAISSITCKQLIIQDSVILYTLEEIINKIVDAYRSNNKVLFCGNGGSAADAQHLAAELSGRFFIDRPGLNAEALHVNTSYVTAVANDYSFDQIFSRLVQAKCNAGDIIFGISTSGNSNNVVNAMTEAKKLGVTTIGFTGITGGILSGICDYCICVPSDNVARIQEAHIMLGHMICEIVEQVLFQVEK